MVLEKTQRREEPGVLQSMGLQTVKHDLATEQHFVQTGQIIHPYSRYEVPVVSLYNKQASSISGAEKTFGHQNTVRHSSPKYSL